MSAHDAQDEAFKAARRADLREALKLLSTAELKALVERMKINADDWREEFQVMKEHLAARQTCPPPPREGTG